MILPAANGSRFAGLSGRLSAWFPKGSVRRNAAVISLAAGAGQGLTLVAAPVITRLYEPAQFGVLAVFVAIVSTLASIGSLNYWVAVTLPENDVAAANTLTLAVLVAGLVTLFFGLLLVVFSHPLFVMLGVPALHGYVWLIPLSVFAAAVYAPLSAWAMRKHAYSQIARTKITQAVSLVAVQLGVGFAGGWTWGLLLGDALGRSGGVGSLTVALTRRDKKSLTHVSLRGIREMAFRYRRFPLLSSGSLVVNNLGQALPILLMAALYGSRTAGLFALGQRVVGVPMRTIGHSVSQVYIGHASALARNIEGNPGRASEIETLFLLMRNRLAVIGAAPLIFLGIGAPWIFPVLFGNEWTEAGVYVQILSAMFLMQFIAVPVSQTLNVLERQDLQLYWDVGRLLVVVAAFATAYLAAWGPRAALSAYAVGTFISYVVLVRLCLLAIRKPK